jgi:hypothetical protein
MGVAALASFNARLNAAKPARTDRAGSMRHGRQAGRARRIAARPGLGQATPARSKPDQLRRLDLIPAQLSPARPAAWPGQAGWLGHRARPSRPSGRLDGTGQAADLTGPGEPAPAGRPRPSPPGRSGRAELADPAPAARPSPLASSPSRPGRQAGQAPGLAGPGQARSAELPASPRPGLLALAWPARPDLAQLGGVQLVRSGRMAVRA